jgi:hypothetical protein
MTTVATVQTSIKTTIGAGFTAAPVVYKNEGVDPPTTAFVYVELILENSEIVAFGGGRGANIQRTFGRIEAHVFIPVGEGIDQGLAWAETIAALFRGVRLDAVSYFDAEVFPADGLSENGRFAHVATTVVSLLFDKAA